MQRDIHRPASTRYAVLYGFTSFIGTSANRFLARSISFAGVFCDFDENTEHDDGIAFVVYPDSPAMSVPIVRISKVHRPGLCVRLPQ